MILRFNGNTICRAAIINRGSDAQLNRVSRTANAVGRCTRENTNSAEGMGRNGLAGSEA